MDTYPRAEERFHMVEQQIRARDITNPRVLKAMQEIPRHLFVPPHFSGSAYSDAPLPIGEGQTISQPYIVALMTALLDPQPTDRILEIGCGSGYQAAILSVLVLEVTTVERLPAVADRARMNIKELGLENINIIVGDGSKGYPQNAPYDGILIAAATPEMPVHLISQLNDDGILVAPVGDQEIQELITLKKNRQGTTRSSHGGVRFVPLIGRYGWSET